jgi:hypothetical protein
MRLAMCVVGMCFALGATALGATALGATALAANASASDSARGSLLTDPHSAALLADASFANQDYQFGGASERRALSSPLNAAGAMGYVPADNPSSFVLPRLPLGEPRQEASARWNPATVPLPATRTLEDHLLTGFVALMLIAYQLRRKHRFLRPHQFST